jgi:hypothetical protein
VGSFLRLTSALLGAAVFAASGAIMGSMNADWFGLEREANALLPTLGIGAALVVAAFASSPLHGRLRQIGSLGRTTKVLLIVGPLVLILSWVIELAIIGTFALGAGLICLAVAVTRFGLVPKIDRVLVIFSAVGSLTWNTETLSAFLLVGVGLLWAILSIRLLRSPKRSKTASG